MAGSQASLVDMPMTWRVITDGNSDLHTWKLHILKIWVYVKLIVHHKRLVFRQRKESPKLQKPLGYDRWEGHGSIPPIPSSNAQVNQFKKSGTQFTVHSQLMFTLSISVVNTNLVSAFKVVEGFRCQHEHSLLPVQRGENLLFSLGSFPHDRHFQLSLLSLIEIHFDQL